MRKIVSTAIIFTASWSKPWHFLQYLCNNVLSIHKISSNVERILRNLL